MPHLVPGAHSDGQGELVSRLCSLLAPLTGQHLQVYYSLWRKLLRVCWWLVVAYTMLVLIAVYTFQFQDFPTYWRNLTGFTDEQ